MKNRSSFGWLELFLGVVFIIMGVLMFMYPGTGFGAFVIAFGLTAIFSGIADIVFYFKVSRNTGVAPTYSLILGVLVIILGILILLDIGAGAWTLTILFPIWFIVRCIIGLSNLNYVRTVAGNGMYWFSLIMNVIGIILGILLIFNPFASALSLVYVVGIYMIISGIGCIVTAFSPAGEKIA